MPRSILAIHTISSSTLSPPVLLHAFWTRSPAESRPGSVCVGCGILGTARPRACSATSPAPGAPSAGFSASAGLGPRPGAQPGNGPRVRGRPAEKAGAWARGRPGPGAGPAPPGAQRGLRLHGGRRRGRGPRAAPETRAPRARAPRRRWRRRSGRPPRAEEAEAVGRRGRRGRAGLVRCAASREILKDFGESRKS